MAAQALTITAMNSLHDQSVSELMLSVADREANLEDAQAAFAEVIRRYGAYLYKVCENFLFGRVCEDRPHVATISAGDLRSIALRKIWLNAHKFDERGNLDAKQQEGNFLAWCGVVTNRVCIDELSKVDQEEVRDDLFWENWPEPDESPSCNPQLMEAFQEAFEQLPAKTREVLVATALYTNPTARHKRMPPKENRALAARLGMTPDAMRKARERGYDSIKSFIKSKGITIERNPNK